MPGIGELEQRGRNKPYYTIELLGRPRTRLIVPVDLAEGRGVQPLPSDHRERRELLERRLYRKGVRLLAGEIAAVWGIDLLDAGLEFGER